MRRGFSMALVVAGAGVVLLGALTSCGRARAGQAGEPRIVSIGGAVTETVFALGAGDRVVAVDTSSVFPAATEALPKVGYQRQLSAEGVLALRPTLVLAAHEAGPPEAIAQIRDAGVRVVMIGGDGHSPAHAREKVVQVAAALALAGAGAALVARMTREADEIAAQVAGVTVRPRVLFVYARGPGAAHVSGTGTPADAMIQLAGGANAIEGVGGFKPLTAEAVALAAPDVILVPARGLASLGGADGLLAQPGMALTPAARTRRIVAVDDVVLLGFGPRLGQGLRELVRALHPEVVSRANP